MDELRSWLDRFVANKKVEEALEKELDSIGVGFYACTHYFIGIEAIADMLQLTRSYEPWKHEERKGMLVKVNIEGIELYEILGDIE